jgi:hypothetical protein
MSCKKTGFVGEMVWLVEGEKRGGGCESKASLTNWKDEKGE